MWAATVAHNGMIACGRVADWASHRIEHEISGIYDLTHGIGMAIIFPAWMKYTKNIRPQIFEKFFKIVFDTAWEKPLNNSGFFFKFKNSPFNFTTVVLTLFILKL